MSKGKCACLFAALLSCVTVLHKNHIAIISGISNGAFAFYSYLHAFPCLFELRG